MNEIPKCKILILGESAVGKTSLFTMYIHEGMSKSITPTIGIEYKQKIVTLSQGVQAKVQVWDTAGTERFRNITPICYRNVDGVLLVFDVTDQNSFWGISYWAEELKEKADSQVEVLLVGNKDDLKLNREISKKKAEEKAKELGASYCEANSKDYESTRPIFEFLIYKIMKKKQRQLRSSIVQEQKKNIKLSVPLKSMKQNENNCC